MFCYRKKPSECHRNASLVLFFKELNVIVLCRCLVFIVRLGSLTFFGGGGSLTMDVSLNWLGKLIHFSNNFLKHPFKPSFLFKISFYFFWLRYWHITYVCLRYTIWWFGTYMYWKMITTIRLVNTSNPSHNYHCVYMFGGGGWYVLRCALLIEQFYLWIYIQRKQNHPLKEILVFIEHSQWLFTIANTW